jgi:hypothetical protein
VVRTDFVGFLLGEGCLMLDLTTMFLFPMIILISLGGVFGGIRLLESGFLCLVGHLREDPHHGQSKEMTYHCG